MSVSSNPENSRDRIVAATAVAAFHGLLFYVLLTGLGVVPNVKTEETLELFAVPAEPPAPPPEPPAPQPASSEAEGAASAAHLKAKASPVIAPKPKVRLEPPPRVTASPVPGSGRDSSAGAAKVAGPGSGSGGTGSGTGSGRGGGGPGGGGDGVERAQLIGGRIVDADYPRSASRARVGGTVVVRFTVGTDGRPRGCRVTRTSGHAELDATTCRLIEQRFRYRPARDAAGRAVSDVVGWQQAWWQE